MLLHNQLEESIGAVCEVRTIENDLLFIGRVRAYDGHCLTIHETGGGDTPPVLYNSRIKICLYAPGSDMIVLFGEVWGSSITFWKVGGLHALEFVERRETFRQQISAEGKALCLNSIYSPFSVPHEQSYHTTPAHLVDISLTGVLFSCKAPFRAGDWLTLMDIHLFPGERPFSFLCRVRRAFSNDPREVLCGCQFERLYPAERDRLCQVIFKLQRRDLSDRRERADPAPAKRAGTARPMRKSKKIN